MNSFSVDLAATIVKSAVVHTTEGDGSLHSELFPELDPGTASRWNYWVELFVFGLFPWDLVLSKSLRNHGEEIRGHARELLRGFVNSELDMPGARRFDPQEWENFVSERFQAYTTAFWLTPGADRSRAMLKFGEELVRRFDGPTRDVFVLTIPGIWFISRLQALHEFMASLEVPEAQRKELDTDLKKEPHDMDVAPDPVAQLRHAALTALQGDESALERLITHHRTRDPQADEGSILTEVIRALRRDRS